MYASPVETEGDDAVDEESRSIEKLPPATEHTRRDYKEDQESQE